VIFGIYFIYFRDISKKRYFIFRDKIFLSRFELKKLLILAYISISDISDLLFILLFLTFSFFSLFVGGVPIQKDRKVLINGCQIAVGTCGRLTHLIDSKMLKTNKITTFILDEADKLMEESFAGNIKCVLF
jgi:hypothetical protein